MLRSTDTAELGKSNSTRMSPGLQDPTREVEVHKRVTNKKGNEQKIIQNPASKQTQSKQQKCCNTLTTMPKG